MEEKFEDPFCRIEYHSEKKCVFHLWKPATKTAGWSNIKKDFLQYVDIILQTKSQNVIVDERDMYHAFSPDEQKWIDEEMMPKILSTGLKKMAIIKSKDAFVELATELMMGENNARKISLKFVQTKEDAESWIA